MWNDIRIIKVLKNMLPKNIKIYIIKLFVTIQIFYYKVFSKRLDISLEKKICYVFFSTDYANLGDHAMSLAQVEILSQMNFNVVEISVNDTIKYVQYIKKNIRKGDIITLKGGGNIGIEYFREEMYRRYIIKNFKNNRIVCFPQTIYFPENRIGKAEFKKTMVIYSKNKNFHLFTRDVVSYNIAKNNIKNINIRLVPDIAFLLEGLEKYKVSYNYNKVILCLRNDVEKKCSKKDREEIQEIAKKYYKNIYIIDTIKDYKVTKTNRKYELENIWKEFGTAKLIITDRLHGMIFAALIGIPCIALENYNYKISGTYEWISALKYIKFIKYDKNSINQAIVELNKIDRDNIYFPKNEFNEHFKEIYRSLA